jgi:hypothetical protein
MTGARIKFSLGLGVLISLVYFSVLRQQQIAGYAFALLLALTLAALLFDYLQLGQFLTALKKQEEAGSAHDKALQAALANTLGSSHLLKLTGTELRTLYYAFFARFEDHGRTRSDTLFGYTRSSNAYDVFLVVALSQLPFLPFVHLLLEHHKGPGPAWLVTLLTLWSVVWYLAQVEAVKFRPIEVGSTQLGYRFGLIWTTDIPLQNIRMARGIDVTEVLDGNDGFMSPLGSTRNVMLEFEVPVEFTGPYWFRKREQRAAISVDNPAQFLRELSRRGVVTD